MKQKEVIKKEKDKDILFENKMMYLKYPQDRREKLFLDSLKKKRGENVTK